MSAGPSPTSGIRGAREKALEAIRASRADWPEIFIEQISREEDARVLTSLFAALGDRAAELSRKILRSPRIAPRAFVWLLERMHAEGRADSTALFVALTDAMRMDEFSSLRARLKELFEPGGLAVALVRLAGSEEEARDLLHALDRVAGLEEHRRATVREALLMKFPELRAPAREYLYATAGAIEAKRAEVLHLKQVELPANAEQMKAAKEYGDLSENFEYHAARQKHEYLSARIATLADELSRTRVLDPARIDASEVRVGTRVRLRGDAGAERDVVDSRPLGLQARERDLLVPVGVRPAAAGRPPGRPREPRRGTGRDRRHRAVGLRLARAAVLETILLAATGLVAVGSAESGESAANIYRLPIGDPSRRDREVPVVLDAITDTATGALILPSELPKRLEGVRLLLVGEGHTDVESHRLELRVLEELVRTGRRVTVGLEMYPYTAQAALDDWTSGKLSEDAFLEASRWYRSWGYHWLYYRDILLYARDRRLPLVAINAPREVVSAVRKKGFQGLTPEEAAHIPTEIDSKNADHMRALSGVLRRVGLPRGHGRRRLAVHARRPVHLGRDDGLPRGPAAAEREDPKAIVVVLVGAGHVQYGMGIERQLRKTFPGRIASLIPVPVKDSRLGAISSVQASYANFVWGVPPEADPLYPELGIATRARTEEGLLEILDVETESPAAAAGLKAGDVLVSFDGAAVKDKETLAKAMAGKRWGDEVEVTVRREGATVEVSVRLRRNPPPR